MQVNGTVSDGRTVSTDLTRAMGERIRRMRRSIGMTQTELAEAIGYKDSSSITYVEQGRNNLKPEALLLLCAALKTSPNELFGWDG
ncbi:helix-turn-helix DNA-binding domain protein [Streptomyces phage Satis]|nr:helix-turn-helix DNA-binding domain protein [Streptomyces phage Satis]